MIQDLNFQEFSTFFHLLSQVDICLTWLKVSGRMVVSQNNSAGVRFYRSCEDELRIGNRSGSTSIWNLKDSKNLVGPVQKQDFELFNEFNFELLHSACWYLQVPLTFLVSQQHLMVSNRSINFGFSGRSWKQKPRNHRIFEALILLDWYSAEEEAVILLS